MSNFIKSFKEPVTMIGRGVVGVFGALSQGVSDLFGWCSKLLKQLDKKMEGQPENKEENEPEAEDNSEVSE